MKAAYMKAPWTVEIREVPLKEMEADEVIIDVKACGICGSDLNGAETREEFRPFGHELAGIVEAVGEQVKNLKPGDRVAAESSSFCGDCPECRNGHVELCRNRFLFAESYNGFAQKLTAKARALVKIDGISYEEGAMLEPMGVALDLISVADIGLTDQVLVMGARPIAIMAVRLAKLRGAGHVTVCARSHSAERIRLAKEYGADEIILTDRETIEEGRRGRLYNRILITTPPATIADTIDAAAFGGIIAVIGIGKTPQEGMCTLNINRMHFKRLQLRFSHATPALFFPECNELIRSGMVPVKPLISHRYPLEKMQEALLTCRDDKEHVVKVMMVNE